MKRIIATCLIATVASVPVVAQLGPLLGGGLPVFDGSNLLENAKQLVQALKQVEELTKTYEKVKDHYEEAIRQATFQKGLQRYRTPIEEWRGLSTSDNYRRIDMLVKSANGMWQQAANGWHGSVTDLAPMDGVIFSNLSDGQKRSFGVNFSTVELADGVASSTLEASGKARSVAPQTEKALTVVEQSMLNDSPEYQTVAQQNANRNALSLIQAKAVVDANRLAAAANELQLVLLRQQREGAAAELRSEINRQMIGRSAYTGNPDDAFERGIR